MFDFTPKPTPWCQADAIALCRLIEEAAPHFGCHVALTGGLLYKDGDRKDADIMLYRIRQKDEIDAKGLFKKLEEIGVRLNGSYKPDWVVKATFNGKPIDFFFPENYGSDDY